MIGFQTIIWIAKLSNYMINIFKWLKSS